MTMTIPEVPFASVRGRNLSCKEIGGDFFDVVQIENGLGIVVCDVSGKGVSAALLGSILQGMVYSQLGSRLSLREIAASANKFLCQKILGEKYATLVIAKILNDGTLEYINCGHVPPVLVSDCTAQRLHESNLPVGLIPAASYESATHKLKPGDRFFVVTDGVTEAENPEGDMFGNERLERTACCDEPFERIFEDVRAFCGPTPLNDDCTVVELNFRG
jgi:serine phosphatase RsbU (regulator of sigma subunit)